MRYAIAISAVMALAACGGSSSSSSTTPPKPDEMVSCVFTTGLCQQATKPAFTAEERTQIQADCLAANASNTFVDGGCDTTLAVAGWCFNLDYQAHTGFTVTGAESRDFYPTATWNDTSAPADCTTNGGSWGSGTPGTIAESETNSGTTTADPMPLGGMATASSTGFDYDYFTFVVPEGGRDVRFQTFDASGATCNGVDTWIEIENSTGTTLASEDHGDTTSGCETWSLSLPAGTYYLAVLNWDPYEYVVRTTATPFSTATLRTASCNMPALSGCVQYTGQMSNADTANVARDCATDDGTYRSGACVTTGSVGGYCQLGAAHYGTGTTTRAFFNSSGWTAATAQAFCEGTIAGTWVP